MKKIIYLLLTGLVLISFISCTGVKTTTSGLENESFLVFEGNPSNYSGGVDVIIDDNINFKAEVTGGKASRPKGNVYAISTGTHTISVSFNGTELYRKQIFVAAQETKKITLP